MTEELLESIGRMMKTSSRYFADPPAMQEVPV